MRRAKASYWAKKTKRMKNEERVEEMLKRSWRKRGVEGRTGKVNPFGGGPHLAIMGDEFWYVRERTEQGE